jgi:protein gp37
VKDQTKIQWAHWTFNPWRGCTKVSAGCANCYAETMSKRNTKTLGVWGPNGTRVVASEAMWREPVKWDKQAEALAKAHAAGIEATGGKYGNPYPYERPRVFCASLADVFEGRDTMPAEAIPNIVKARGRLMGLIEQTPNLDWLLLTKRPENVKPAFYELWNDNDHALTAPAYQMVKEWDRGTPPAHVWLGTSVEDQETADKRIPHLLKVPAKVRFLSMEPLLGPVDFRKVPGFNKCGSAGVEMLRNFWVIVGGESGPNARPCNVEWIRDIVAQCKAAGVPCFVKQMGSRPYEHASVGPSVRSWGDAKMQLNGEFVQIHLRDSKGGDWDEWPEDLCVREVPA